VRKSQLEVRLASIEPLRQHLHTDVVLTQRIPRFGSRKFCRIFYEICVQYLAVTINFRHVTFSNSQSFLIVVETFGISTT
jgi:hypothetical protein